MSAGDRVGHAIDPACGHAWGTVPRSLALDRFARSRQTAAAVLAAVVDDPARVAGPIVSGGGG